MKRWFLAAILAALSCSASAAEIEYTLKMSQAQVDTILMALTKAPIPYEVIWPVLQAVAKQAAEQQKAAGEDKKSGETGKP